MNLIYFDDEQLIDYLFGNVEYNKAYNHIIRKTNSSIWTGVLVGDYLKIIQNDGRYFSQQTVKVNNITSVWVRGKMPRSLFKFLKSNDVVVFNDIDVQKIADDKNKTYNFLNKLMPKQFENYQHLISSNLPENKEVIIKPFDGLKGQGISIVDWSEVSEKDFEKNIVQEVVKPSKKSKLFKSVFGDIKEENYDIRMVCVDSNIAYFTLRRSDDRICNAARGASLTYIPVNAMNESHFNEFNLFKDIVLEKLPNKFKKSIFSIDFCLDDHGNYIIFELNSYPGIRYQYKEYINLIIEKINEIASKKKTHNISNDGEISGRPSVNLRDAVISDFTSAYSEFLETRPSSSQPSPSGSAFDDLIETINNRSLSLLNKILKSISLIYNNDLFYHYFPNRHLRLEYARQSEIFISSFSRQRLYNLSLFENEISNLYADLSGRALEINLNLINDINRADRSLGENFQKALNLSLANNMAAFLPYMTIQRHRSEVYFQMASNPSYIHNLSVFLAKNQKIENATPYGLTRSIIEIYGLLLELFVDDEFNPSKIAQFFESFKHICNKMSFFVGMSFLNAFLYDIYLKYFSRGDSGYDDHIFVEKCLFILRNNLLGKYLKSNTNGFYVYVDNPFSANQNDWTNICGILKVGFRRSASDSLNMPALLTREYSHVANKLIYFWLENENNLNEVSVQKDLEIQNINAMFMNFIRSNEDNYDNLSELNQYFDQSFNS